MSAIDSLAHALDRLEHRGESWPCNGGSTLWISDDPEDREAAAFRCQPCPVLELCGAAGDEIKATAAVWGGIPRGNAGRRGRPRKSTTEQKAS